MTELMLGTKKGPFVLHGGAESGFEVLIRAFAGETVEYAMRDPRSDRVFAAVNSPVYGPKLFFADDPAQEWTQAQGLQLPESADAALERIWVIATGEQDGVLYAGGDPGVLFESRDGGASWELNASLWNHPTRPRWQPGGGGLCLHSIVPWPDEPERGFPLAIDPDDPDSAYVIPLRADIDRVTPDGHVGVFETRDGGATWTRRAAGLPQSHAYLTILRLAFDRVGAGPGLELYFGATSGEVFGSGDGGAEWFGVVSQLPPVYSLSASPSEAATR